MKILISFFLCSLFLYATDVYAVVSHVKLALNWKPEPQFGGFYAAQTADQTKQHQINIEIQPGGAGTPVVQMIAAGQADFGIVSADEVIMSRSHGGDVVALFAAYQTNPQGIMSHTERGFKSIGEIYSSSGTLAIQKGLPYAMFLERKFSHKCAGNCDGKTPHIVPYLGGIQNYLSDKNYSQQCFITSEPLAAEKRGAKTKTFLVAEEGYNPYTTVLITRGEFLKKNPELVKSMVAAVRAGWRDYLDHPDATNKVMAELNKSMDMTTFIESANAQKSLIDNAETAKNGLGTMTAKRWSDLEDQLLKLKLIDRAPDVSSLFINL